MEKADNQTLYLLNTLLDNILQNVSSTGITSDQESVLAISSNSNNSLWTNFLNSSRNGSAQKLKGQSLKVFLEGMSVATIVFFLQLILFNFLKAAVPWVYQPNFLLLNLKKTIFGFNSDNQTEKIVTTDRNEFVGASALINSKTNFMNTFWNIGLSFKWIFLIFTEEIEGFENMGLDSFYFLRFLTMLQNFFGILTCVVTPCLTLIHYKSSKKNVDKSIKGLDKISIYTVTMADSNFLLLHLCLTVFIVVLFHWFLINEIDFFVTKKLSFIKSIQANHDKANNNNNKKTFFEYEHSELDLTTTEDMKNPQDDFFFKQMHSVQSAILIHDLPEWNYTKIIELFNKLEPNKKAKTVSKIWYIPKEIGILKKFQKKQKIALERIEKIELNYILCKFYNNHEDEINLYFKESCRLAKQNNKSIKMIEYQAKWLKFKKNCNIFKFKQKFQSWQISPVIEKNHFYISRFRFNYLKIKLEFFYNEKHKDDYINRKVNKYLENMVEWKDCKKKIQEKYLNLQLNNINNNKNLKHAILKFDNIYMADIFCQLLLTSSPNSFKQIERNVNFDNIIWSNIALHNNYVIFISHCLVNFIKIIIIIGWVVPVAFLGLIFQIPYLTKLIPFLRCIYNLSDLMIALINSLVPILTLMLLTDVVPEIFRWLIKFKFYYSYDKIELNLQQWFYVFSFVQIFIVVTISSSISLILEQIVTNPTKIPNILASNFPQCSNFFVSFIFVRGLSYSMSNLLQWPRLISWVYNNNFFFTSGKLTPRNKFEQLSNKSLIYKWGSIYPIFTLMASISLIYGIIQPAILPVVTLSFGLVLVSFKFTIKYQVNRANNKWETMGKFYPIALFQLYSGLYCLEGFMLGLFILSKKYKLGVLMFIILISSVVAHCNISKRYKALICFLPLSDYENLSSVNGRENLDDEYDKENSQLMSIPGDLDWNNFNKTMELIPVADPDQQQSVIWIPNDVFNISNNEIDRLKIMFGNKCHISNTHAKIDSTGTVCIH